MKSSKLFRWISRRSGKGCASPNAEKLKRSGLVDRDVNGLSSVFMGGYYRVSRAPEQNLVRG
jgi:hypothetical protein